MLVFLYAESEMKRYELLFEELTYTYIWRDLTLEIAMSLFSHSLFILTVFRAFTLHEPDTDLSITS